MITIHNNNYNITTAEIQTTLKSKNREKLEKSNVSKAKRNCLN